MELTCGSVRFRGWSNQVQDIIFIVEIDTKINRIKLFFYQHFLKHINKNYKIVESYQYNFCNSSKLDFSNDIYFVII